MNLTRLQIADILKLLYDGGGATADDIGRWYNQGFVCTSGPFLCQHLNSGGPCGVLAAVQSEIVIDLFFVRNYSMDSLSVLSQHDVSKILVTSLARIIKQACPHGSFGCAVGFQSADYDVNAWKDSPDFSVLSVTSFSCDEELVKFMESNLNFYTSSDSYINDRGIELVRKDMDIEDNTLIGRFGHCSQELINLLLTGSATSNVMDGEIAMGSGLMCRGLYAQPRVGYLTVLEAKRLCEVGSYYKVPQFPVWIVGSSSHFTLLFSLESAINEVTQSERLQAQAQRAFRSVDSDGFGFIPVSKLSEVFCLLKLNVEAHDSFRLQKRMQLDDSDIILWSSFWESVSRLMAGEDVAWVLSGAITTIDAAASPMRKRSKGEEVEIAPLREPNAAVRMRSDSDLARDLQSRWDATSDIVGSFVGTSDVSNSVETRSRSDSDFARDLERELNCQNDAMAAGPFSVQLQPTSISPSTPLRPLQDSNSTSRGYTNNNNMKRDSQEPNQISSAVSTRAHIHRHDSFAGEDDPASIVYHYNAFDSPLRSSKLTKFKLTRRSSDQTIGYSGLSLASSSSMDLLGSAEYDGLESVLRTRWQGCRVDWLGQPTPAID